jgi:protein phosphatase PTC7
MIESQGKGPTSILLSIDHQTKSTAAVIIQNYYRKWRKARLSILTEKLLIIRNASALFLQGHLREMMNTRIKKLVKQKRAIKWEHGGTKVFVKGSFTNPPWEENIELGYYPSIRCFISKVLIHRNTTPGTYMIKYLVDDEWKCNGNLPLAIDSLGNYNNIIVVPAEFSKITRLLKLKCFSSDNIPNEFIIKSTQSSPLVLARPLSSHVSPICVGLYQNTLDANIKLLMGGSMKPKPRNNNVYTESADAYFVNETLQAFAVADGVGEWGAYGLNPSDFSRELIKNIEECLLELSGTSDILEQAVFAAYYKVKSYGSSTLLAGSLRDSMLSTISLGDSSFIVLRPREFSSHSLTTIYRSSEQQHRFNCPYQVTHLPSESDYTSLIYNGFNKLVQLLKQKNRKYDTLLDSVQEIIPLRKGDIIIAGTDGLYDNLYDHDIIDITQNFLKIHSQEQIVDKLPEILVREAWNKSCDKNYKSPFAKHAAKVGKKFVGGKFDDITVLVLLAVSV